MIEALGALGGDQGSLAKGFAAFGARRSLHLSMTHQTVLQHKILHLMPVNEAIQIDSILHVDVREIQVVC